MKQYLKKILEKSLFFLAQAILKKYHPKVIGITGSIGKTSTKEAIFTVLKEYFRTRTNIKNYNNEIGLPLTIIGRESPGSDWFGWLKVFWHGIGLLLKEQKNYPEVLVLEMGIDRCGDMEYLTDMAPADIGVETNVSPVHLEYFKTLNKIAEEKSILIKKLNPGGWGVLNADNPLVYAMRNAVRGRFITYGFEREAQVRGLELNLSYKNNSVSGLSFKISYNGAIVPVFLPNVLAKHLAYSVLGATAVGIALDLNLVEVADTLKYFSSPAGRMKLLAGINNSQLIDDTYNASPEATLAALDTLEEIEIEGKKIAVLGDMLELGDYEIKGHQLVGKRIAEMDLSLLVAVGERSQQIANSALAGGFSGEVKLFADSLSAGQYLLDKIGGGDLVLLKGSQGMRMERAVKLLLAEPERASELLVRQDANWQDK